MRHRIMKTMKPLTAIILLLCITMLPSAAYAKDSKQEAKKYFKSGQTHYKLGRFKEALDEYSKAYEAMPLSGFLFNIGQCHRELKNYERAIFFYEGYLREKPDAKNRSLVEDLIAESKRKLEIQKVELRKKEAQNLEEKRRKDEQLRQAKESEFPSDYKEKTFKMEKSFNARTKPDRKSKKFFGLFKGTSLKVVNHKGKWALVERTAPKQGWVPAKLLEVNSTSVAEKKAMKKSFNARAKPDKKSKKLFGLKRGIKVNEIRRDGKWALVEKKQGKQGWVPASFLIAHASKAAQKKTMKKSFNARAKPDKKSKKLFALKNGTEVNEIAQEGEWLFVQKAKPKQGWVLTNLLSVTEDMNPSNIASVSTRAEESTPIYKKWWFWTIIGVGVAAAAGGTVYAITSNSSTASNNQNGEIPNGSLGTLDWRISQ